MRGPGFHSRGKGAFSQKPVVKYGDIQRERCGPSLSVLQQLLYVKTRDWVLELYGSMWLPSVQNL